MVIILGGKCTCCRSLDNLQFDCIDPQGHAHHGGSAPERICYYRRQMLAGNVQLLCGSCNALKSDMPFASWLMVLQQTRQAESELRLSPAPGRGPTITPADRIELLRHYVQAYHRP
jgi:hypothetical protein